MSDAIVEVVWQITSFHVLRHQPLWCTSVRMSRGWPLTLWFTPVRMSRVAHLRRSCRVSVRSTTPHRHERSKRTNQMWHATVSRRVNLVQSYGNNAVNMTEHMYGRRCPPNRTRFCLSRHVGFHVFPRRVSCFPYHGNYKVPTCRIWYETKVASNQ